MMAILFETRWTLSTIGNVFSTLQDISFAFWLGLLAAVTALFLFGFFVVLFNRKKALKFYRNLLYDDALTEIKNVNYLREHFNNILIAFDQDVSMYYLNIDNFKNYNDLLGHTLANNLLHEVASRLKTIVEPYGTVYRMHSDHFILLYPSKADIDHNFSNNLLGALKEPYQAGVHTIKLTTSIGRYVINAKNPRFNDCLLRSELALQEAKMLGKDQIVYYSSTIKRKNHDAFSMYRLIKDALKDKQFFLEYQPIIERNTMKIVGLESLIRIQHKDRVYYPQEIIAYAEKYHLIEEIDRYVVNESFKAFKRFDSADCPLEFMSVNISTTEIKNKAFIDYIVEQAELYEIEPSKITVEFTETYSPEDFSKEANFIKTLQAHGFQVAIDDFGSGYSSMIRLSQNQLDKIKIDRSFITDITKNKANQKIVKAIINLSETFGLEVIVEGVETEDDLNFIKDMNVKYYQGYYFHKSLSENVCIKTIRK